ncbi:MAG: crossover junction endodeoxyribonuclease RuvC [Abitibacteriaceae bacterium]|nr:crossover junction endodeoxyribonuclease RuvC [Abditibacteriaceae bacterium]
MPPKTQPFVLPTHHPNGRVGSTLRRVRRLQGLPTAHRILGVDPGLHRTGYGLIELRIADCGLRNTQARNNEGQNAGAQHKATATQNPQSAIRNPQLIEAGVLTARATDELPRRLQSLYDGLCEVLREHQPDVVVIEELFSTYAHPRSALLMAHARGVLMLAAQQAKVPVHHFLPNEVKQVITGNGHATKAAVQSAVRSRLRLVTMPHPPDVADALALALCFAARQSVGERLRKSSEV